MRTLVIVAATLVLMACGSKQPPSALDAVVAPVTEQSARKGIRIHPDSLIHVLESGGFVTDRSEEGRMVCTASSLVGNVEVIILREAGIVKAMRMKVDGDDATLNDAVVLLALVAAASTQSDISTWLGANYNRNGAELDRNGVRVKVQAGGTQHTYILEPS